MKKLCLCLTVLCLATITNALTLTTTKGNLATLLSSNYKIDTITELTLNGTIDARDFKTMRDLMPALVNLNLSNVTVSGYSGAGGTSNIGTVYTSSTIPTAAFQSKVNLKSIVIPSNIQKIEWIAFAGCSSLDSLRIPASVSTISEDVFSGKVQINVDDANLAYSSLDGVLYNKNKTALIFCPTNKVGNFSIPNTVTSIERNAFSMCQLLTTISIPNSVNSIGYNAFEYCKALESIEIPAAVTTLIEGEFSLCTALKTVVLPNTLKKIGISSFYGCSSLTNITIPDSVSIIDYGAFEFCSALSSINIPQAVTEIWDNSFSNCSALKSIYVANATPVSLDNTINVFEKVDALNCKLYVPKGSGNAYKSANVWKEFNVVELVSYLINDTATYHVSDIEFQAISPVVYYKSTDSLKTQFGLDSITNHYSKFVFEAKHCTDTAHVTVTDTSYISVTDTLLITKIVTGLSAPNNEVTIKMYPNPAKDFVVINVDDYTMLNNYNLVITNASGQQVYSSLVTKSEYSINVQSIGGNGLYIVSFKDAENKLFVSKRLIVK